LEEIEVNGDNVKIDLTGMDGIVGGQCPVAGFCCSGVLLLKVKVKIKLSLCLTKHHTMKTYWGVEV
jgi:hypothetical protein